MLGYTPGLPQSFSEERGVRKEEKGGGESRRGARREEEGGRKRRRGVRKEE